jgi:uncharacterized protein (TIGR00369 family)
MSEDFFSGPMEARMTTAAHAMAVGMEFVSVKDGVGVMRAPWREELVGDPETGVIASGVVTALIDHTCGLAIHSAWGQASPIATLDLRIDYMRPAEPGRDVLAYAECYKVTRRIAFVRGIAYHDDRDKPIANATATFMFTGRGELPQAKELA